MTCRWAPACWVALLALTLGSVSGCSAAAPPVQQPAKPPVPRPPAWLGSGGNPLSRRMHALATRLEKVGWEPTSTGARGFLAAHDDRTFALQVPSGRCLTLVALASGGVDDLDATLYASDGTVLAQDREADAHPTVQVCGGPSAVRVYYAVQVYDGAGAFAFGAFEGSRGALHAAAEVVGGRPGVALGTAGDGGEGKTLSGWLGGIEQHGFRISIPSQTLPLAEGQHLRLPLSLQLGHCYTVVAVAGPDIEALGLRVVDELDRELAADRTGAKWVGVQVCPERSTDAAVELYALHGGGKARMVVLSGFARDVGGASSLWLGETPARRAIAGRLEEEIDRHETEARRAGYGSPHVLVPPKRLASGEAMAREVSLRAGRCTIIMVAAGRGARRVWMHVEARGDRVRFEDERGADDARATLCVDRASKVRVVVVARSGAGRFALLAASKARALAPKADAVVQGPLLQALEESAARGWTTRAPPHRVALPFDAEADVPDETCARVVVVPVELDGGVDVSAMRSGHTLAQASGKQPHIEMCRSAGEPRARIHIQGDRGARSAWVITFDRSLPGRSLPVVQGQSRR